ncbi:MAG: hypothetical protein AAGI30_08665 [Planctomycetota bacterium]
MSASPRVLVLAGGPDGERDVSIEGGATVAAALRDAGFTVEHRVIDRPTVDELGAMITSCSTDVVVPLLHGPWGEGGVLQAMLQSLGIPFVGSQEAGAHLAMDKRATKRVARAVVPDIITVLDDLAVEWEALGMHPGLATGAPPVVVKPNADGSSLGVTICPDESALALALTEAHRADQDVIVEPMICGREITVPLLEHAGTGWTSLPICEVEPSAGVYDHEAKYHRDDTRYTVHPPLPDGVAHAVERATLAIAERLGLRHLCRADYIIETDHHGPTEPPRAVFLEINTMPGFTAHSFFPMTAAAAGIPLPALCAHLVHLAMADTPAPGR